MRNFQGFGDIGKFRKPVNGNSAKRDSEGAMPDLMSILPDALHCELRKLSLGDQFFDAGHNAAIKAGCEMLFEVPAMLVEPQGDRCAALQYRRDGRDDLLFLVFDAKQGTISIVSENEVSRPVANFTRSYAGVLGMIASDHNIVRPLIH
jgi:hypothetical protein